MQLRVSRNIRKGKSMNHQPRLPRAAEPESVSGAPLVVDSVTLMSGRRELIIRHGEDTYRLRVTASNKLILTK
jgi:hemin uptake protein HemP